MKKWIDVINFLRQFRCPVCMRGVGYKSRKTIELIKQREWYLDEKERLLRKQEELFEREREAFAGKEGTEVKKAVLIESMKAKWNAERKMIDAETTKILSSLPDVIGSLDNRKDELNKALAMVRGKPNSSSNNDLKIQYQSRLDEINYIIQNMVAPNARRNK